MEDYIKQKMDKDCFILKKEKQTFYKRFQGLSIKDCNQYADAVSIFLNMNLQFYQRYVGMIPQQLFDDIINNYVYLIGNLSQKIKFNKSQKVIPVKKLPSEMCAVCQQNIRASNIQYTYNCIRQEQGILGNIKRDLRIQNKPLFTQQEDVNFFKAVKKLINQKQNINQFQIYQAEGYIAKITQTILLMENLKQLQNQKLVEQPKTFYDLELKQEFKKQLSDGFLVRLPPWIHKMIQTFEKIFQNRKKLKQRQIQVQTIQWEPKELIEKRFQCQQLNKQIKIEKQKFYQLTTELQRLNAIIKLNENKKEVIQFSKKKTILAQRQNNSISYSPYQIIQRKQKEKVEIQQTEDFLTKNTTNKRQIIPHRLKRRVGRLPSLQSKKDSESSMSIIKSIQRNDDAQNKLPFNQVYQHQNLNKFQTNYGESISIVDGLKSSMAQQTIIKKDKTKEKQISIIVQKKAMVQQQRQQNVSKVKMVSEKLSETLNNKFDKLKNRYSLLNIFNRDSNFFSKHSNLDQIPQRDDLSQNIVNSSPLSQANKKKLKKKAFRRSNPTQMSVIEKKCQQCYVQTDLISTQEMQKTYNTLQKNNLLPSGLTIQHMSQLMKILFTDSVKRQSIKMENQNNLPPIRTENKDKKHFSLKTEQDDRLIQTLQQKYGETIELSFSDKDFQIFKDIKTALMYEQSFCQNYHKNHFSVLNQDQQFYALSLYKMLDLVKNHEKQSYKKMCAFIRYPYQVIMNQFQIVNIVSDMSLKCFKSYFQRIVWIHRKCDKKMEPVCQHIQRLTQKLQKAIGNKINANYTL